MSELVNVKGLVSVIVPVYKVEAYIQECVSSIVNQSYPDIEIILVDDAGGDRSMSLALEILQQSNRRWKIITHETNKGVSAARNIGIFTSCGEYFYLADSDDFLEPFCIERMVEVAVRESAEMVFANHWDIEGNRVVPSVRILPRDVLSENPLQAHIDSKTTSMAGNRLINKEFYSRSGVSFVQGIRYEDERWSFSLIVRAKRIAFLHECTYFYRRWDGSFTYDRVFNLYKVDCLYENLLNSYNEANLFSLYSSHSFRLWFARKVFRFLEILEQSNLSKINKLEFFDRVFRCISIPEREFNRHTLYLFVVTRYVRGFITPIFCVAMLRRFRRIFHILKRFFSPASKKMCNFWTR